MQPYLLAPHVYPCVSGQHVVLMDLERDKYVAVVPAHRLARWVRGWPVGTVQTESPRDDSEGADPLVSQMLAHGMLVSDPHVGKPAVPVATARPQRGLVEFDLDVRPQAGAAQLWRFARSYLQAQLSLKLRPIQSIVEAVRDRKARQYAKRVPQPADPAHLRSLATAFARLRPLFYTLRCACLLDSLTMLHFLSAEGIHPDWVFGVKTEPFDAHCWVQCGEVLLNDVPDRVRQYSPILVV
jgi:Transglutaminase-like superfamily